MNSRLLHKVTTLLADELSVAPTSITPASRFVEDLGADSLDVVEIIMRCEEEWEIEISDDQAEAATTVEKLVGLLEQLTDADPEG